MSSGRRLALVASAVMLAAVGAGLWINGSPAGQRDRRLDERRIADLRGLEVAVGKFHAREGRLPGTLDDMAARLGNEAPERRGDPVDGQPYEYRPLDARRFELCARFARPGTGESYGQVPGGFRPWRHDAGRQCFVREVTAPVVRE